MSTAIEETKQLAEPTTNKWVYLFEEGSGDDKSLLGGKGAGLCEMTRAGLPVPPGLIVTTEACNAFFDNDKSFPAGLWDQVKEGLQKIEQKVGKKFGDPQNPLLVSVRSGAAFSMPGMMDTVLNLGLNEETVTGLAAQTGDLRFALDAYRRFASLFGEIVMGVAHEKFERVMDRYKAQTQGGRDTDLKPKHLRDIIAAEKQIILAEQHAIPEDPYEQLRVAIAAVFNSWMGRRAIDYRRVNRIADSLGTAVNVQAMVFGNMGEDSGTGVAFTRNPSTGKKELYGEYLLKAQGEDVVAGIRTPNPISQLKKELPKVYEEFASITGLLERQYRDMQDCEFTIERGKLWMLQTRTGKRSGAAAVRVAVEMVGEKLIDRATAVQRVTPEQLDQLLHPTVDPKTKATVLATGLPASPGAAQGQVVFSPDEAEELTREDEKAKVILVRQETSPDDFHGMVASQAIVTARGGMTSHAAVVARGMGKPCVCGAKDLDIDYGQQQFTVDGTVITKGDWITVDGSTGRVFLGQVPTIQPTLGPEFHELMTWADKFRRLRVRANADTPLDAKVARQFGAEGIGLCRTEHMFFGDQRLAAMREMILADGLGAREKALDKLLPLQRGDFVGIFREMVGLPVTIRLLDPPLHEFLPNAEELMSELSELKMAVRLATTLSDMDNLLDQIDEKRRLLRQVNRIREANPMLGFRGCRLGLVFPEVTRMQCRAIFEAACLAQTEKKKAELEIMVPLVSLSEELRQQRQVIDEVAQQVMGEQGMTIEYRVGTMIELPRAALMAQDIAAHADFFSFGTNDLTQTTFGLSRDDSSRFLPNYVERKIMPEDPFQVLDREGVGQLVRLGTEGGRRAKPDLKVGICGEHGGDPSSIAFCDEIGLNYVSCSPFRVPVARLAAAQATLAAAAKAEKS
ncbi:MAG: pyruvate, orthophosphate dikinase [Pyrinomonadaceae bacterium]|jgi:pyruvate,orthophosphate dikinase|nr:pyruvate, orthophosphate dikinase [Pyrinomonadaceae bacterium]MDQ1729635.1 pyruvate, orthophosphate dikinase [Pyrinomonadaceae bacterium]